MNSLRVMSTGGFGGSDVERLAPDAELLNSQYGNEWPLLII
jgi:hypothetical protein